MFLRYFYYHFKPYLPWRLRLSLRRLWYRRIRRHYTHVWPIKQTAGHAPAGWPGWPGGKKFAFVLTHDVETAEGLECCRELTAMERRLNFRSSFNFVPEGSYTVPSALRTWLAENGFEVGVHDLKHDGKLYRSRGSFKRNAERINRHLKDWNVVGFRSGFMLHNLEWLHDLNIEYDASTFDTDPFEPQPDGADTIFPFWVPAPGAHPPASSIRHPVSSFQHPASGIPDLASDPASRISHPPSISASQHFSISAFGKIPLPASRPGYVELPYTLPQDFCLYILLQEQTIDIWKRKLDWIASRGGMALLDVHPDYLSFSGGASKPWHYPARMYREFLDYARAKYHSDYWHALPKDVAQFVKTSLCHLQSSPSANPTIAPERDLEAGKPVATDVRRWTVWPRGAGESAASPRRSLFSNTILTNSPSHRSPREKIWIDLDNTPHVPFFEPIIDELQRRGYPVLVTARDAFQVCELADQKQLPYLKIGRHYGRNRLLKVLALLYRALQLAPAVWRERPALAVSHGARSQIILSNLTGIPTVLVEDYEHAQYPPLMRPQWILVPEVIPSEAFSFGNGHIRKYAGLKEDVYAWKLRPDPRILGQLGISETDLLITVRPPATEAHYHNPDGEALFVRFMEQASQAPHTRIVLLPRNRKQRDWLRGHWPQWFADDHTLIPDSAVDGMNLIWHSDLVVSGGGTMNREAAALGVPVYSLFCGPLGAVDRALQAQGRLVLIQDPQEIPSKIRLEKRQRPPLVAATSRDTLHQIVSALEAILEHQPQKRAHPSPAPLTCQL